MTQEDRQLLLVDLSARLPYGIKGAYLNADGSIPNDRLLSKITITYTSLVTAGHRDGMVLKGEIKPYLFPLSSMTEKQKAEYEDALTYHDYVKGGWTIAKSFDDEYIIPYWFVDFCNKHHLDYRGLIPKGLAIDCTNLNIY